VLARIAPRSFSPRIPGPLKGRRAFANEIPRYVAPTEARPSAGIVVEVGRWALASSRDRGIISEEDFDEKKRDLTERN
jgi:hypothetical protein